jgi:hypothetical protein
MKGISTLTGAWRVLDHRGEFWIVKRHRIHRFSSIAFLRLLDQSATNIF